MQRAIISLLMAAALLTPRIGAASAIYTYLGNFFQTITDEPIPAGAYDTSMRIEGWVELVAPLAPDLVNETVDSSVLAFSFSDGRQTIETGELGNDVSFTFTTDGTGSIVDWSFIMRVVPLPANPGDQGGVISSVGFPSGNSGDSVLRGECLPPGTFGCDLSSDLARNSNLPGTWTLVPEPSTAALTGLGCLVLGWSRMPRSRRKLH